MSAWEAPNGVPHAVLDYRMDKLVEFGIGEDEAVELAPTLSGRTRSEVDTEALDPAKSRGVYVEPEPEPDPDEGLDPGELAAKYGARLRSVGPAVGNP